MPRTALGLGIVSVLLAVAAGCTMCCHPYDQCGPVFNGSACSSCSPCYRANSVLSGTPSPMPSPALAQRQAEGQPVSRVSLQKAIRSDAKSGDVAGSQRIVSVTDRKVESSATPASQSSVTSESSPEPASTPTPRAGRPFGPPPTSRGSSPRGPSKSTGRQVIWNRQFLPPICLAGGLARRLSAFKHGGQARRLKHLVGRPLPVATAPAKKPWT